jgi:hypothetical protein
MTCIPGHQQQVASLSSMFSGTQIENWREIGGWKRIHYSELFKELHKCIQVN